MWWLSRRPRNVTLLIGKVSSQSSASGRPQTQPSLAYLLSIPGTTSIDTATLKEHFSSLMNNDLWDLEHGQRTFSRLPVEITGSYYLRRRGILGWITSLFSSPMDSIGTEPSSSVSTWYITPIRGFPRLTVTLQSED